MECQFERLFNLFNFCCFIYGKETRKESRKNKNRTTTVSLQIVFQITRSKGLTVWFSFSLNFGRQLSVIGNWPKLIIIDSISLLKLLASKFLKRFRRIRNFHHKQCNILQHKHILAIQRSTMQYNTTLNTNTTTSCNTIQYLVFQALDLIFLVEKRGRLLLLLRISLFLG